MSTRVVESWSERARAYAELTDRWPLFGRLADRLVATLPSTFTGRTLDLAGGAGLVSQRLKAAHPRSVVYLLEPAVAMRALARERLGPLLQGTYATPAEDWGAPEVTFDAVLSSAALHLCDEERVFAEVARHLAPGGLFAFHLWGHSFDETETLEITPPWQAAVERALARRDPQAAARLSWPDPAPRRVRTRAGLSAASRRAGLPEPTFEIFEDSLAGAFFVDFAAMSPSFLAAVDPVLRAEVIAEARLDPGLAAGCKAPSLQVTCSQRSAATR